LLEIPGPLLYAGIIVFAMVGAYALNHSTFDLGMAIFIGIVGLLFRRYGYPITPLILGVILGPQAELELRRALQIAQGDPATLVATPFSVVIYVALALALIVPRVLNARAARKVAA
jgi:putative tricarboxylic transport membrane protein